MSNSSICPIDQALPLWGRVDLGAMTMKRYFTHTPKLQG